MRQMRQNYLLGGGGGGQRGNKEEMIREDCESNTCVHRTSGSKHGWG